MNRLRGERVLVEFEEEKPKELYRKVGSIEVPVQPSERGALRKAKVVLVGERVHSQDLAEGMVVHVREHQGERLYPSELKYLYRADDIVGND